jgi:hypothetical protein
LGFLGTCGFAAKTQVFDLLVFLGFPWILSSETRLINGLGGIFSRKFSCSFSCREAPDGAVQGHADAQNFPSGEPNWISGFLQSIAVRQKKVVQTISPYNPYNTATLSI